MDNINQELLWKASFFEKQSTETRNQISFVEQELVELEKFHDNLHFLNKSKEKTSISSLGKGIYLKTSLEDKDLLVEVGSGVVVRKSIPEAQEVILEQMKKLKEARLQLITKFELYQKNLQDLIEQAESIRNNSTNQQV